MNPVAEIDKKLLEAWRKLRETSHEQRRHRLVKQIDELLDQRLKATRNGPQLAISR